MKCHVGFRPGQDRIRIPGHNDAEIPPDPQELTEIPARLVLVNIHGPDNLNVRPLQRQLRHGAADGATSELDGTDFPAHLESLLSPLR
jgi:hypothetical protein